MGLTYDGITYRSLEEQVRYDAEQVKLIKQADVTINENLQTINTALNGKLDKPATPTAESAVVIGADGKVITKTFNEIVLPITDKPYEFIEEIKLTEDTTTIDRTFNNFFTKLYVKFEFPAQTSSSSAFINVDVKGTILNKRKVGVIENFITTSKRYALLDVSVSNNMLKNNSSFGIPNQASPSVLNCVSIYYGEIGFGEIKGIIFTANDANMPAGTVIKLYGVRA